MNKMSNYFSSVFRPSYYTNPINITQLMTKPRNFTQSIVRPRTITQSIVRPKINHKVANIIPIRQYYNNHDHYYKSSNSYNYSSLGIVSIASPLLTFLGFLVIIEDNDPYRYMVRVVFNTIIFGIFPFNIFTLTPILIHLYVNKDKKDKKNVACWAKNN